MASRGTPKGSKSHESHGIVTLRNSIRKRSKRGWSFIDMRSNYGQNAVAVQAGLIAELSGIEHISIAEKVIVELVGQDLFLLNEIDQHTVNYIKKLPSIRNNPRAVAQLYSYRAPIVSNLASTSWRWAQKTNHHEQRA